MRSRSTRRAWAAVQRELPRRLGDVARGWRARSRSHMASRRDGAASRAPRRAPLVEAVPPAGPGGGASSAAGANFSPSAGTGERPVSDALSG